jgi:hypothetical protein
MKKAQIIKYKCCEQIYAACMEPLFYTSRDWQKDVREAIKKGDIVDTVESTVVKFNKCICEKPQLELKL